LDSQGKQGKDFENTNSEKTQELFSTWRICTRMRSHTITESLTMSACKIKDKTMIDKGTQSEIDKFPVSNNSVWMTCHTAMKTYSLKR
jgi:hypothetical protein